MPKVTEEYMQNKKKMIADAAYRVCLRKPLQMVTMTDVIEETGLSQGGIYRFYKDLDEILSDMLTNLRSDYNIIDKLEAITGDTNASFQKITHGVCDVLADVMEVHLLDIQKINFDVTVLAINEPERAEKIMQGLKGRGNMEYLVRVAEPKLAEACRAEGLIPKKSPEDIFRFISAAYSGIEMTCIVSACYKKEINGEIYQIRALFDTLATTIITLFGGEDNEHK